MSKNKYPENELWLGIDVGSTTVKAVVIKNDDFKILFSDYKRHNAEQSMTVYYMLKEIYEKFPNNTFRVSFCGSAGDALAKLVGAFFIQEVVANTLAVKEYHSNTSVAIELGGQDAKVIFFARDKKTGQLIASDMRMNGSCAGGTGAFIDQVAQLLNIETTQFESFASRGTTVYDISGRCGVFAKTDIQPLLNQGVSKNDIALSTFHAIAKQTIGGLAQGMEIKSPVIFEGGPLTFNPTLIEVFKERLGLNDDGVIIPKNPEIIVALGAAMSVDSMYGDMPNNFKYNEALELLKNYTDSASLGLDTDREDKPLFENNQLKEEFLIRHKLPAFENKYFDDSYFKGNERELKVYLGIDGGSTTTKFVLIDEDENLIYKYYSSNMGSPLDTLKKGIISMKEYYTDTNIKLDILGVGATGYAENLFSKAMKADYHTVETVSHSRAAQKYDKDVSFILDIGGQDMKAMYVRGGIVTGIVLNEACSAGCGSFLETYAKSLNIPVTEIADYAFKSKNSSVLGSRCTVFMNSSIITEQKSGKTPSDIMAGLCKSIIENVFTKVVRNSSLESLGKNIIVQGGTFKNDAVLRAFEQYTGLDAIRPDHPGEMGAIGIALLTKQHVISKGNGYKSTFIGLDNIEDFSYKQESGIVCRFCTNNCKRTIVTFSDNTNFITGNRCERGTVIGDPKDKAIRDKLKEKIKEESNTFDMISFYNKELVKNYPIELLDEKKDIVIGIPKVLEFYNSLPFWNTFWRALGYILKISDDSTYSIFESGLKNIPSDTACFPAKIAHGHIQNLINKKVDKIFMPMMYEIEKEHKNADGNYMCALVMGYPLVINYSDNPKGKNGIDFLYPAFRWLDKNLKITQLQDFMKSNFNTNPKLVKKAIEQGEKSIELFKKTLIDKGQEILKKVQEKNEFAIIIGARPYHYDELINHDLSKQFTSLGINVLTVEAFEEVSGEDLSDSRIMSYNPFHTRLLSISKKVSKTLNLELAQIVSFGCGHDSVLSDEIDRILKLRSNKELLMLKLDEGDNKGPVSIRVKSFIETIRIKRNNPKQTDYLNEEIETFNKELDNKNKKVRVLSFVKSVLRN